MNKRIALAALLIGVMVSPSTPFAQVPPRCLHGPAEQQDQRARREQALKLAEEINRVELEFSMLTPPRSYARLDQLPRLTPTPTGFSLQLDATISTRVPALGTAITPSGSYTFSLKDITDPCGYTIFSDQERSIYEAVPRGGVKVRPVESQ